MACLPILLTVGLLLYILQGPDAFERSMPRFPERLLMMTLMQGWAAAGFYSTLPSFFPASMQPPRDRNTRTHPSVFAYVWAGIKLTLASVAHACVICLSYHMIWGATGPEHRAAAELLRACAGAVFDLRVVGRI